MCGPGAPHDAAHSDPRRRGLALTVLAGVVRLTNAISALILLINTRWTEAVLGVLTVVAAYWFAIGSGRSTPWGLASRDDAPPVPAPLSDRRAMRVTRTYLPFTDQCHGSDGRL